MIERNCEVCGKVFLTRPYEVKRGKGRMCSHACSASRSATTRRDQSGSANPNWKGGIKADRAVYLAQKAAYRRDHPQKYEAHRIATGAIRRKELVRMPCEVCGVRRVDAHHDDYSKPLSVRWLCRAHHMQHHALEHVLPASFRIHTD